MNTGPMVCLTLFVVFLIWAVYVQIAGWRRTKGFRGTMEMNLADRFHDEVIYQLCYRRGYNVDLDMNDDAHWVITRTSHPNKKIVKIIVFWAMILVMMQPYSYRSLKIDGFDDFDPKWMLEE